MTLRDEWLRLPETPAFSSLDAPLQADWILAGVRITEAMLRRDPSSASTMRAARENIIQMHQVVEAWASANKVRRDIWFTVRWQAARAAVMLLETQIPDDEADVNATDAAKRLAAECGVDLTSVTGTGKDDKITKADVEVVLT